MPRNFIIGSLSLSVISAIFIAMFGYWVAEAMAAINKAPSEEVFSEVMPWFGWILFGSFIIAIT